MSKDDSRSTFGEFCEVSTCMGVIDLYHARNVVGKVFWAIVLAVSIAITLWQTHGAFRQFINQNPYKTTVSTMLSRSGLEYPNITVCNFNRAKQSVINESNLNPQILHYVFQLLPNSYTYPLFNIKKLNIKQYEREWSNFVNKSGIRHPMDFFRHYGHSYNDTVISVSFKPGIVMLNDIGYEEVLTVYGLCWNIIPNRTELFPASQNSIKLLLNPKIYEYMTDTVINNYLQEGLIIAPNYANEPLLQSSLYLPPGTFAKVGLSISHYKEVRSEFPLQPSQCVSDATLTILNETYTPNNCFFDCYLLTLWKRCGCVLLTNAKLQYPLCNLTMATYCALDVEAAMFLKEEEVRSFRNPEKFQDANEIQKACMKTCHVPCGEYREVSAIMTSTNGVSRKLKKSLLNSLKAHPTHEIIDEDLVENLISLNLCFATPEIIVMETSEATPIFTFIGEVGGQLGLWIGVSMLTLIQCIYYFILAIFRGEIFHHLSNLPYFSKK